METHRLPGIWNGCAHPMQETSIIFYPDGNGLLFYFWGSQGPASLSEFKWNPVGEYRIQIEWIVKYDYDYNSRDAEDENEGESPADDSLVNFIIKDGELFIHLGMHDSDNGLRLVGSTGEFNLDKQRWTEYTATFNPFMKGRQVWIVDDGKWHKTPFSAEQPTGKPWWKFW